MNKIANRQVICETLMEQVKEERALLLYVVTLVVQHP